VGRLLRDVGGLPGNVGQIHQEVGCYATDFSESSLISFFTPSGREGKKKKRKSASARNKQSFPALPIFTSVKNEQIQRTWRVQKKRAYEMFRGNRKKLCDDTKQSEERNAARARKVFASAKSNRAITLCFLEESFTKIVSKI
jgi:hypothetical protein